MGLFAVTGHDTHNKGTTVCRMRYAVVINLDYNTNPADECRELWRHIRQRMVEAGFRIEGRLFTANLDAEQVSERARVVVDSIDVGVIAPGKDIFGFLKEFYAFDQTRTVNLLLPPAEFIQIEEG